ncbi:hypothetical protein Tco_0876711 [Tanacetum coccineum]|uniref:Uncharacterized protein n=1 Tax=Tanacetum coccineum TaxID=301880 RepID=A0ABQ5BT35_9ASTR
MGLLPPSNRRMEGHTIVRLWDLNGVSIALVARFEVISKSTDRIFGAVGLWVNNQGACLAVETAGEGVGLAVGQPGIAGKGRRVWLSLTAGLGAFGLVWVSGQPQRVRSGCGLTTDDGVSG